MKSANHWPAYRFTWVQRVSLGQCFLSRLWCTSNRTSTYPYVWQTLTIWSISAKSSCSLSSGLMFLKRVKPLHWKMSLFHYNIYSNTSSFPVWSLALSAWGTKATDVTEVIHFISIDKIRSMFTESPPWGRKDFPFENDLSWKSLFFITDEFLVYHNKL